MRLLLLFLTISLCAITAVSRIVSLTSLFDHGPSQTSNTPPQSQSSGGTRPHARSTPRPLWADSNHIKSRRPHRLSVSNLQRNLQKLAESASRNLHLLFNNATQRPHYQKKYQCSLAPVDQRSGECGRPVDATRPDRPPLIAYLVSVNGTKVVESLSAELEEKMKQKTDAVKRSVRAAEQAYVDYKEDNTIKGITYFNAKRINRPHMVDKYFTEDNPYRNFILHYDTHFKADVNLSHSVVHVPTNVFDGSTDINNGAKWTMRLNDIFVENRQHDQSMYWQYFGSALGFYRVFPGSKWATSSDKVEMFDCRTKGWYIQASCSPKDLVILLDSSGSMLGLRFRIAMNTVDQILKTLGEDDFFNIIKFDTTVEYVDQCFNGTLLQATAENKERLRRKIRRIDPKEMADFELALTEAFTLFNKTSDEDVGSHCNRAIMLITDGAHDTYEWVFEKFNNPNRTGFNTSQVRVFSFLIGQDAGYNRAINWMACRNKGYYVEIKTIAAVQDNMKQYVTTLARPLSLVGINDVTWTGVYMDEAEYEYASAKKTGIRRRTPKKDKPWKSSIPDMRLMASVAAPVFDRKHQNTQGLLGVVATDLPIHFFNTFVAPPKLGVDAYAFAVNRNGFVLFHPDYKPPMDAPDFTNIDLSKIEVPFIPWDWYGKIRQFHNGPLRGFLPNGTEIFYEVPSNNTAALRRLIAISRKVNTTVPNFELPLRDAMVNAESGQFWMTSLKTTEDHMRPKAIGMHYFYTPIQDTPFTLGLAIAADENNLTDYGFIQIVARVNITQADMTVLEQQGEVRTKVPSQWNYCLFSAEELEVLASDYEIQLQDMYREFEVNCNNETGAEKASDLLQFFEPSTTPELFCKEQESLVNTSYIYVVNETLIAYNRTAINIYNTTYQSIERFTYTTELNETEEYYTFNMAKCIERVKAYHVEQLRDDLQAWMFEKKFEETLKVYIDKGKDSSKEFHEKCDLDIIEHLLFDAEMTNDTVVKLVEGLMHFNARYRVSLVFIATHSGLTRYATPEHMESDFINAHPETIRESYYQRAVEAGPDTIVVSIENPSRTAKRAILAQAIFVQDNTTDGITGRTAVAVAGMEMPAVQLSDFVFSQPCENQTNATCPIHCSNSTFCYLLDDNGYIVSSEYESLIGRSMAEVDPNLFIELTNYGEVIDNGPSAKTPDESKPTVWNSLYEMILFDDYQAVCPVYEERHVAADALRLINPFTMILRFSLTLVSHLFLFLYHTATIITSSIRELAAENLPQECLKLLNDSQPTDQFWSCTVNETASGKFKMEPIFTRKPKMLGNRVCTKRYNIYRLNPKATRLSGEVNYARCHDCSNCSYATLAGYCFGCTGIQNDTLTHNLTWGHMPNCTRSWRAQPIAKTNLVLLVADNWCVCKRNIEIAELLENKTLEHTDDAEQCQMLKMPRKRRRPPQCASDSPNENVEMCGSAQQLCAPCNWLIFAVTTIILTIKFDNILK